MPTHLQQLEAARSFLGELSEKPPHLPYEPTLLLVLFAATREGSTASVGDLTALIERSQKLATRVLSIANSACYALESTVTSLSRAVSILGFQEVRSLVIMVGAVSAIKSAKLPHDFDAHTLWKHQLETASIAKAMVSALTHEARPKNPKPGEALVIAPDEAYATGLLHDIGKVFLAASRPDIWAAIEDIHQSKKVTFAEAEEEYWGMDHGLVGAQVLHFWKLPLLLTDTINWHHAPSVAPSYRMEASVLAAADIVAHEGLDENGAMPARALALMPEGADTALVAAAVQKALDSGKADAFAGMAS